MTNQFDAQLDKALDSVRDMLPESVLLRLKAKLRQIYAERPDLDGREVVNIALDVFEGDEVDARLAMEEARARVDEAAAAEARLASMQRIAETTGRPMNMQSCLLGNAQNEPGHAAVLVSA